MGGKLESLKKMVSSREEDKFIEIKKSGSFD
jgi:hypothetical protein